MKKSAGTQHLRHVASLGLGAHLAIPEMLETLRGLVPGLYLSFFWTDARGAVRDIFAPHVVIDAFGPALIEFDRLDPAREPTLDKLIDVGRTVANGGIVHATHDFSRSFLMNEVTEPFGVGVGLDLVVREAGAATGVLFINREKRHSRFTADEMRLLADLQPHFAQALREATDATASPAADAGPADREGALLVDETGAILSGDTQGFELLARLADPLRLDARARARLFERLPAPLLPLIARLRLIADGRDAPAAAISVPTRWGRFSARAFPQRGAAVAAFGRITAVSLTQHVTPPVAVLRHVRALDLSPRERQIAFSVGVGERPDAIAARLMLSPETLRFYLKSIYRRTGAAGRQALHQLLNAPPPRAANFT